jgi:hypothetical protein
MGRSTSYHMLVSSLPALPPRFDVDRLPITYERLQKRLGLLEPEDAQEIDRMIAVFDWARQFKESNDAAVVKRYNELMKEITNPLIREVLEFWIDVRMIAVAMRSRRRGSALPTIGFGRYVDHLRRNFNHPEFKLGHLFPWIVQADREFAEGSLTHIYRSYELGMMWDFLKRRSEEYYFSFETIVLYVARWDIIRRWQQLQPDRGREVFDKLVSEALGEYANLYS